MQLTIRYKTRYLDFEVKTKNVFDTQYVLLYQYVTACYYISQQQSFTSNVNIWGILPNEIQVEIEKQIN